MSEPGTDGVRSAQGRILVVDEVANVRLIEAILVQAGYSNVRSTVECRTVVGTVDGWCLDLILLDLAMPAPDGYVILERLLRADRQKLYRRDAER